MQRGSGQRKLERKSSAHSSPLSVSVWCSLLVPLPLRILATASDSEKQVLEFSPNLIFFVILPPIILDAGYTLKRKDFFHNLGSILLLAVVGTVLNNLVFGYLMYGFAKLGWIPLDPNSPLECLLFGAVVSATDTVATLAVLGSKEVDAHPLLYSLVFGESVLNDAIAIVLYKTFESALPSADESAAGASPSSSSFGTGDLLVALGTFLGVSLGSVLVGVGVALCCCGIFRKVDLSHFPIYEFTLVTLFAYLSYFMAEMMYLSGIMSLFFCSICLAHYNYYKSATHTPLEHDTNTNPRHAPSEREAQRMIEAKCRCTQPEPTGGPESTLTLRVTLLFAVLPFALAVVTVSVRMPRSRRRRVSSLSLRSARRSCSRTSASRRV